MIYLLLKSYINELLSIAMAAILVLSLGLYFIFKQGKKYNVRKEPSLKKPLPSKKQSGVVQDDFSAFSGDDPVATKLDLAKAYLEADRNALAKSLLQQVLDHGNDRQQQEARHLLASEQT